MNARLALQKRRLPQIIAIEVKQIESLISHPSRILPGQLAAERLEIRNALLAYHHRFTIDPMTLARVDEEAGRQGKAVIGFYHSHPDHPAKPSEYDRTHVPPWSYYSHIIVAIEKGEPAAMTCWVLNEQTEQFDEQRLQQI